MQLACLDGVFLTDASSPVDQQPQHLTLLVTDHRRQPGHAYPDQRDGVRVRRIGLATLTGREDPHPRR